MSLYDPAKPQPEDILSDSQEDLLNNFTDLDTYLRVNHVAFDEANFGKHNFLTLPRNTPGLATGAQEVGLYCRHDNFDIPQLFFRAAGLPTSARGTQMTPMPSIFAWGTFDEAAATVGSKYNISSVAANVNPGDYTITFENNLASQEYFPFFISKRKISAAYPTIIATTVNTIRVGFFSFVSGSGTVPMAITDCRFIIWGD